MGDSDLLEESIDCYERAISIEPDHVFAYSNLLFSLSFGVSIRLSPSSQDFGEVVKEKAVERNVSTEIAQVDEFLRVGFVSRLRNHPVGHFLGVCFSH